MAISDRDRSIYKAYQAYRSCQWLLIADLLQSAKKGRRLAYHVPKSVVTRA